LPKPIPVPDELSKPFWDAVNQRQLVVQSCTACNRRQYPPQPTCAKCGSKDHLTWLETSGRGRIQGYVVERDTRMEPLVPDQPFNIAVIELQEDPQILFLSHLPGVPLGQVPVGARVEVRFDQVAPGQLIHEWQVENSTGGYRPRKK